MGSGSTLQHAQRLRGLWRFVLWANFAGSLGLLLRHLLACSRSKHLQRRIGRELMQPDENELFRSKYFLSKSRVWIAMHTWLPLRGPAKAVLFLCHGFGEHSRRYQHVAEAFSRDGFLVVSIDHQGHGESEGDRGYVESFDQFVDDYCEFISSVLEGKFPSSLGGSSNPHWVSSETKKFILGHSMGSLVALSVVERLRQVLRFDGVILSGAALVPDPAVASPAMRAMAGFLSYVLPKFGVKPLDPELVCEDPTVCARYVRDPLNFTGSMKARIASEMLRVMPGCLDSAKQFPSPVCLIHGEEDRICRPEGSAKFYEMCSVSDKSIRVYPGVFHEVLNGFKKEEALQYIVEWASQHC